MSNTLSESQTLTHIHTESEEAQIVKMSVQSKLQPKKKLIEDVEYREEEEKTKHTTVAETKKSAHYKLRYIFGLRWMWKMRNAVGAMLTINSSNALRQQNWKKYIRLHETDWLPNFAVSFW